MFFPKTPTTLRRKRLTNFPGLWGV
jgi:hypothetical protein